MDYVKFEKEKAIARFNSSHRVVRLRQFCQVFVVFGLTITAACIVESSAYLFNHHVVFLIGNAIIVCLFMLCRQNGDISVGGDLYGDYVKYSEAAAHQRQTILPSPPRSSECGGGGGGYEDKQIVVCAEETMVNPQCDDVLAAIEKATKQINRFRRIQSEKMKREIARPELLCETDDCRKIVRSEAMAEMENLSSEEFRRRVDAFIDAHRTKRNQL